MKTAIRFLFLAILAPALARANGYNVPNVNPRDLAMGGSLVAAQRDAAAVGTNPAALTKLDEGLHLSIGGSLIDLASTWTAPDGGLSTDSKFDPVPPPALFASWSGKALGRGYGVGAGLNIPAGGAVKWPSGWEGQNHILLVDRKVYAMYLTGGVELASWARLGGGAVYYHTTEHLKQGVDFLGSEGVAEIATSGGALSYDVAAEFDLPRIPVTLAVDYKHKADQHLEGEAHFTNVPTALEPSLPDQDASHTLVKPNTLNIGAAVQATKTLLVTAGWTFDRYTVYTEDRFVGDLGTTVEVDRRYGNGHTFRVGAEWKATPRLELRAGILRDLSGLRKDTFSPSLPDGDTWGYSAGASWAFAPNLAVHAAVFYAPFDEVKTDPTGTNFQGSYDTNAKIYALGFTWHPALGAR